MTLYRTNQATASRTPRLPAVSLLRWLSLLTLASLLLVQFASASSSRAGSRADGPEVVMDTTKRDFGEVFVGEELDAAFVVRNAGAKPLELSPKSELGVRPAASNYTLTAALWHPSDGFTRSIAAMRAAPS